MANKMIENYLPNSRFYGKLITILVRFRRENEKKLVGGIIYDFCRRF